MAGATRLFLDPRLRSFWNRSPEGVDQLGDSREDRAIVGSERGVTILQPGFDRSVRHPVRLSNRGRSAGSRLEPTNEVEDYQVQLKNLSVEAYPLTAIKAGPKVSWRSNCRRTRSGLSGSFWSRFNAAVRRLIASA
jgi:hypothetical protein